MRKMKSPVSGHGFPAPRFTMISSQTAKSLPCPRRRLLGRGSRPDRLGVLIRSALVLTVLAVLPLAMSTEAAGQSLRGSPESLDRQNAQARAHNFTYLETPAQVRRFVEAGYLVPVRSTADMEVLRSVSFPYARPEVRLFLERLSTQYRAACGEQLVVTSLTRPLSNQPPNASVRSVHPTGMAVDLRRSANARCRSWLERTLMSLEGRGVIEAIVERRPPHYHVAVYPRPYAQYVARITGATPVLARAGDGGASVDWTTHHVRPGETLSGIAARHGTSVTRLRTENNLQGNRILAGQRLRVPVYTQGRTTVVADAGPSGGSAPQASAGNEEGAPERQAASAPSVSASASPAAVGGASHRVARGESLWTIARRYGVTEADLRRANGISGSRILVGQELTIPAGAVPSTHRVARGESLWTIARRHGTTVEDLRQANGIGSSGRIVPGQELVIPAGR